MGLQEESTNNWQPIIAFDTSHAGEGVRLTGDIAPTLTSRIAKGGPCVLEFGCVDAMHDTSSKVRKITIAECEKLMGFTDGYTNVPCRNKSNSPDGPRYKSLGNSIAVPVINWIGKRIQLLQETS